MSTKSDRDKLIIRHLEMHTEVIIAIIGLLTSISSGVLGYMGGRRKDKAESAALEAQTLQTLYDFYKKELEDIKERLEQSSAIIKNDRKKKFTLRSIVDRLVEWACMKEDCPIRERYPVEEIDKIFDEDPEILK